MKLSGDTINKIIKILVGLLLIALGCVFLAQPLVSMETAVLAAGVLLIIMSGIEIVSCSIPRCRQAGDPASIVTALFKLVLGVLLLLAGSFLMPVLPAVFAIWLGAFGIFRIMHGIAKKREGSENWISTGGVGIIAIVGAVMLVILNWVDALDMIAVLVAVVSMLYGFVLLMDSFIRTSKKSAEEILEEDREIADEHNAEFRTFEKKLKKD